MRLWERVHLSVGKEVQTTKKNVSEGKFAAVAYYGAELERYKNRLAQTKREILEVINSVDDGVLRSLLFARYVSCMTWSEVSDELHYCRAQTFRLYKKAVKRVQMRLNETIGL